MSRYIILILFFGLIMMSSTGQKTDPVKSRQIDLEAKNLTDRQLDSISVSSASNTMIIEFRDIRAQMDSLNKKTLMAIHRADTASKSRDSVTQAMIRLMAENSSLKASNEQYRKEWDSLSKSMDYIFLAFAVYLASLASQGTYNGYKEWRDKNKKK